MIMRNYVISLTTAEDRRIHIKQEFGKQGIDFEFFDAVTPNKISLLSEKFKININDANLTQGELACLFSHVSLWQKCLDDNLDYIAIFEDDVYLSKNAHLFLKDFYWIPKDIYILKIEKFDDYCFLKNKRQYNLKNAQLSILNKIHYGTAGYILSKKGASILLDFIKKTEIIPIDHIMFDSTIRHNITVYQINPAICIQSDRLNDNRTIFESKLENDRRTRFKKKKPFIKFIKKVQRELIRPFKQFKVALTTMPFNNKKQYMEFK